MLTAIVLVAVVVGAVAIWRGVAVQRVAALVVLVFMVMNKIYSPQYTLWVVLYGLLADWDLWTIVALSLVGLVDDANAAVHIALVHDHAPQALAWFDRNVSPREEGLRLLSLVTIGGAMLARAIGAGALERSVVRGGGRAAPAPHAARPTGALAEGARPRPASSPPRTVVPSE